MTSGGKINGGNTQTVSNCLTTDNSWSYEDYFDKINFFKNIDMSDLTNSLAALNLSGSLLILLCFISILMSFYGNKLIAYFNLQLL